MKIKFVSVLIFLFYIQCSLSQESGFPRQFFNLPQDTLQFALKTPDTLLILKDNYLIPGTEKLAIGHFKLLKGIHYQIDYRSSRIQLHLPFQPKDSLQIIFRKYPFPLIRSYAHRFIEKPLPGDTSHANAGIAVKETSAGLFSDLEVYQSNLKKSGSLVRGIQIGSNQDLTLNSGLNLQLSGEITPGVELVAALTDESTPIQPEGNTQVLREVDKVFVKIKSPYVGGTLGDFNLKYGDSQFGNLRRKLQGISIENEIRGTRQQLTFGTSRGTFHTNKFLGQEGKQGPYQLVGKNGEKTIIVLAGTEKVYVDGELMQRGENNDYIIDYALAQITFTNKRLITSQNRIEVDFEYTAAFQRYGKNLLGFSTVYKSSRSNFFYDLRLFREWDDTRNLLEDSAPLTAAEKNALKQAGDDPFSAVVSGITSAGDGKGSYVKADTVLADTSLVYYRYVGAGKGRYRIQFSNVGDGKGSYRRERLGIYRFVGPGKGDYLPIRFVPLATDKQFADLQMGYAFSQKLKVQGEFGISNFDRNVFSTLQDQDNVGSALRLAVNYQDSSISVAGLRLGKIKLSSKIRNQQEQFSPLDRPFLPEYSYNWNLFNGASQRNQERRIENDLDYQPWKALSIGIHWGQIQKGEGISSTRQILNMNLRQTLLPGFKLSYENVDSRQNTIRSTWKRLRFRSAKTFGNVKPLFQFYREDRQIIEPHNRLSGFSFDETSLGVRLTPLLGINWQVQSTVRGDQLYNPDRFAQKLKLAETQTYEILGKIVNHSRWQGRFSFVYRKKDFTPRFENLPSDSLLKFRPDAQFQDTTWQDRQSHLANLELQYRNRANTFISQIDYQASSELDALKEKVYLKVGENRGNFRFDEQLGEYVPDPQGNFILVVVPTGRFQSITKIEAAWRIQYRPRKLVKKDNLLSAILHNISSITYARVQEESRERDFWQLYLLNLSRFHNSRTTLRGTFNINQDILIMEKNPDWGIQLRSRYRDNLTNQFLDAENNESRIVWERIAELRKRWFRRKVSTLFRYQNNLNKRFVSSFPLRNRNIMSHILATEVIYRPSYRLKLGTEIERGWETNRNRQNFLKLTYWEVNPTVSYAMQTRARATLDVKVIHVNVGENPFNRPVPFEMGKGKKGGTSWLANLRIEYFLSKNITLSVTYTGRKDALSSRPIHLGQAEVRAFF